MKNIDESERIEFVRECARLAHVVLDESERIEFVRECARLLGVAVCTTEERHFLDVLEAGR